MKRAVPALLLTAAGLVPLWMFEPASEPESVAEVAAPVQPGVQAPATSSSGTGANANKTVAGPAVETSEGTVQVQVVFQGKKIVDVQAIIAPNSAPTKKALPILRQETLQAQSAEIDSVSGATATSGGYVQSLQAAIDLAQ